MKPQIGDKVKCRIKDGTITKAYGDYDETYMFDIIAETNYNFVIYVPEYLNLKHSSVIDEYKLKKFGLDKVFKGAQYCYIDAFHIEKVISKLDGMKCSRCKDFHNMAASNQEDGSFICYSCKKNPYR